MSLTTDDEICKWLLTREPNWSQFLEDLWKSNKVAFDTEALAKLCWTEQNFENFATLIRHCLLNERDFPWPYFCEFLCGLSNNPIELIPALSFTLNGIIETKSQSKVCKAPSSILLGVEFKELFLHMQKQLRQHFKSEKRKLLSNYETAKFQRLSQEQDRLLKEMLNRYPKDNQILSFKLSRDEEIAAESLSQHNHLQFRNSHETFENYIPTESREFFNFLLDQIRQRLNAVSTETLYEYAVMFEFLEAPEYALELMELYENKRSLDQTLIQQQYESISLNGIHISEPSSAENRTCTLRSWRILDLLVLNKQWLSALNFADELEATFSAMPDAAFSSSFVKAQCLWHLGHKESGVELLKSLLKIRPRFKNGEALLRSWLGSTHDS